MVTKTKTIAMLIIALQLIFACGPRKSMRQITGKFIPIKLLYNKPFKLGDTIFVSYKFSKSDLVSIGDNLPITDFENYSASASPVIVFKSTSSFEEGKYVNIIGDVLKNAKMIYNSANNFFEGKYGFIPSKKGIYQAQNSAISITPPKNTSPSWRLPMYFEGDNLEDQLVFKDIEVE